MKILQVIQKLQNRGAETFAAQLSNHLVTQGHQVLMVAIFKGTSKLPFKGEIICLDASPKNKLFDFPAWKKLAGIIKEFDPDIVQANSGDTLKYSVFSKKFFKWKSPIIARNASEMSQYVKTSFQKKFNEFLFKEVQYVISVSHASQKDIINLFPFLKLKTEVIPVGLEIFGDLKKIYLKPDDLQHIIHVGGFSFEKNHKGLFNIFSKILESNDNIHLHLLGDGPLKAQMEMEAEKRKLTDKVTFYGFVNNPISYINAADLLVLPSIIEGLPGVLLEAMMVKTSVIAYNVGGISEIVNENTGTLISKNDETTFATSALALLKHKQSKKLENAREMVLKNFLNVQLAIKFVNSYQKILVSDV